MLWEPDSRAACLGFMWQMWLHGPWLLRRSPWHEVSKRVSLAADPCLTSAPVLWKTGCAELSWCVARNNKTQNLIIRAVQVYETVWLEEPAILQRWSNKNALLEAPLGLSGMKKPSECWHRKTRMSVTCLCCWQLRSSPPKLCASRVNQAFFVFVGGQADTFLAFLPLTAVCLRVLVISLRFLLVQLLREL